MSIKEEPVKQLIRRGRPPKRKPALVAETQFSGSQNVSSHSWKELAPPCENRLLPTPEEVSLFAEVLHRLLKGDHQEIARLARQLQVTEVTIYRWLRGKSRPRPMHLQQLLTALPDPSQQLLLAIQQTFPSALDAPAYGVREVQKDLYRRVMELLAETPEPDVRRWQITQAVFDYALLHLDPERQGLAMTYAHLMPPRADGVHSLYEAMVCGSTPWPTAIESPVYLGNTTLAGMAAMSGHMLTWDGLEGRVLVDVDDYEWSACAHPVTRGGRIVGVLVVSSTQPGFFANPLTCQSVVEYAHLVSLGFYDEEFMPVSTLNLSPLPPLSWQRAEIARSYTNRILACVRDSRLPRHEAELVVRLELEKEFEALVHDKRYSNATGVKNQ